jgi:hypothetical protein
MASERLGSSDWPAAHASMAPRMFDDSLMAVTGSWPVAGRPGLFRTTFFFDNAMKNVLRLLSLKNKRPADVLEHAGKPYPKQGSGPCIYAFGEAAYTDAFGDTWSFELLVRLMVLWGVRTALLSGDCSPSCMSKPDRRPD